MPSAFPGMDPYLEAHGIWPGFHHSFAVQLSGELNGSLPPGHYAKIVSREELGTIEEEEVTKKTFGRLAMVGRSRPRAGCDAAVSFPRRTASPSIRVNMHDDPIRHLFVEIRDPTREHKLITVIEIVSPFNKVPGPDREAYEAKQREVLESDASLIEIDLLRGGSRIVPNRHVKAMIDRLKPAPAYVVLVNRAWKRSNAALAYHVYPTSLREPLPCIWVPLKEHEDEILLDLQHVFNQVHDAGPYRRGAVDYAGPPAPPALDNEDAAWAAELTRPWREASAGG